MVEKENKIRNLIGYILLGCAGLCIVLFAFQISAEDIWYDEVFSMGFIGKDVNTLLHLAARDVHPPFYYLYLKAITESVMALCKNASAIIVSKAASILPLVLLGIVGYIKVARKHGMFTYGLFMLLVTIMPNISNYYVEIRMYSLALFFITFACIIADEIAGGEDRLSKWIAFFVLGIMTAYTQYYALVAVVGIYVALGIALILYGKHDKKYRNKNVIRLVVCAVVSVVAYIPWLPVVARQVNTISGNYWIQPLSFRSIFGCIKYIIMPVANNYCAVLIGTALIGLTIAACVVGYVLMIKKNDILIHSIIYIMPLILVILSGFVLSAMGTPIFVYRYMIPTLGAFWLMMAMIIGRLDIKVWPYILSIALIVAGGVCLKGFYDEEHKKVTLSSEAMETIDCIPKNSVIVTNFDHITALMGYYRPDCYVYIYDGNVDKLIPQMFERCGKTISAEKMNEFAKQNKHFYFFGSFNSREDIVDDWHRLGIDSNELCDILVERYWIKIYEESYQ